MIIESMILIGCGIRLCKLLSSNTNTIRTKRKPVVETSDWGHTSACIRENQKEALRNMGPSSSLDPAVEYYNKEIKKMFKSGWENDPEVIRLRKEMYVNTGRNKQGIKLSN